MTAERVSKLQVITGSGKYNVPLLDNFEKFIRDELLDFGEGDYLQLLDLDVAQADEVPLGPLTSFESRCYALAQLVEQSIQDTLLEYEASATESMARYMREHKVPIMAAMQHQLQHLPQDIRLDMNKRAITHTTLMSVFDWSVRQRYNQWQRFLVVRKDFVVHCHG